MRNGKIILLVFLVVALLPYLVTCFYALPFADDFCFGWTAGENISFFQKFLRQYLHWNGRYTSDVLVNFHPLTSGSLLLYQCVSFVSIVALLLAMFVFIRKWVAGTSASLIAATFFLLFYLCYQPNITEGVYWYIGLVNYHWGSVCFLLQLVMLNSLINEGKNKNLLLAASLILLAISVGFNEVAAAVIPVYYLAAFIYFRKGENAALRRILLFHFLVAFEASLFVIFSPGNFTRADAFEDGFRLGHSLLYASLQAVRFIGTWSLSVPFVALSLIVIAKAETVKSELKKIDYRLLLALLLFTVFMAAFLPYMATGILGQHRTMNYVFPFFIVLWVSTLLSLSHRYQLQVKFNNLGSDFKVMAFALLAVVFIAISGRSISMFTDFNSGLFNQYRAEFMQRQGLIIRNPDASISPLKNIPNSFQVVDTRADTTYWADKCMKRFYTGSKTVLR